MADIRVYTYESGRLVKAEIKADSVEAAEERIKKRRAKDSWAGRLARRAQYVLVEYSALYRSDIVKVIDRHG